MFVNKTSPEPRCGESGSVGKGGNGERKGSFDVGAPCAESADPQTHLTHRVPRLGDFRILSRDSRTDRMWPVFLLSYLTPKIPPIPVSPIAGY